MVILGLAFILQNRATQTEELVVTELTLAECATFHDFPKTQPYPPGESDFVDLIYLITRYRNASHSGATANHKMHR